MRNIVNTLRYLPKSWLFTFIAAILMVLPLQIFATPSVQIEAKSGVANVTTGQNSYNDSVNAKVDDVLKVQMWYHNKEDADSGKIAKNLRTKVTMPTQPGKAQTVKIDYWGDNTNSVNDNVTVNLSMDRAYLEFVPGSVQWRHNAGTNANPNWVTEKLSDRIVTGQGTEIIEDAQPCFNFEATVTFLMRVKAPVVSITKQVREVGESTWKTENTAKAGETMEYLIAIKNEGNTTLKNVVVGDNLPARMSYVSGSTMIANDTYPGGKQLSSDNITKGGIDIGNYAPGANAFVKFRARIDSNLSAGEWTFKNVAVVRPEGMNEFYNTAITRVIVNAGQTQQPAPSAVCVDLDADKTSGIAPMKVKFDLDYNTTETTFESFVIDFGDGTTQTVNGDTVEHTYTKGEFTAKVTKINTTEVDVDVNSTACQVKLAVAKPGQPTPVTPEQPEQLPNTGPAETVAGLLGSAGLGAGMRSYIVSRRKLLEALLNR